MTDVEQPVPIPPEVRSRALHAAILAFERVLVGAGLRLDFFERMQALEDAMNEGHDELERGLRSN